jgi:hypothetical protein
MKAITFTTPKNENFSVYGLGTSKVVSAIRDNKEVLCLVGEDFAYRPIGGRKVLKNIIDTCIEGVTYYWKAL